MQSLRGIGRLPIWATITVGSLLVITGCATETRVERARTQVEIGGGLMLSLPAPSDLGEPVSAAQSVVVRHNGSSFPFETRFGGTGDRIRIVGLDPMGRRALTLEWTEKQVEMQAAPWFPSAVPVRNLLADIVMIYWPAAIIGKSLSGPGAALRSGPSHRSIISGDREVVRIDYELGVSRRWSGTARYRNLARGYSLVVRSVEVPQ